jgi:DNA (cytosine-5)-methyltransferase 1
MVHLPYVLGSVDLFAGGGGASLGIEQASGVSPLVAVNHNPHAIAMHAENHPRTRHYQQDVFDVAPADCLLDLQLGQDLDQLDLLWASPDCTHHSRAKGGKPLASGRRALADVVVNWARDIRPRVLALENVPEFLNWGPLYSMKHRNPKLRGRPIPSKRGQLFKRWRQALEALGYVVEHRVLKACDYGTPTTRARLFIVARCDGEPIGWPEPTHGPGLQPYRTAAECIDWTLPCPSIFTRKRPLAEKTQARIAEGVRRFVLQGRPFLVDIANQGGRGAYVYGTDEPVRTMTTKASHCLVAPSLISTRNGERKGQAPRCRSVEEPFLTVTATGSQGGLVAAHLTKFYGTSKAGTTVDAPMPTVLAGGNRGGGHLGLVAAFIAKHNGGRNGAIGQPMTDPMHAITARDSKALVQARLARTGDTRAVAAFILKYYGQGSQWSGLDEPMHTVVAKARMGLVTVEICGETYALTDIGMRMLQPHELAHAQGFSADYQLTGTKTQQTARIGNSVCPPVARAIVEANFGGPGCPGARSMRRMPAVLR